MLDRPCRCLDDIRCAKIISCGFCWSSSIFIKGGQVLIDSQPFADDCFQASFRVFGNELLHLGIYLILCQIQKTVITIGGQTWVVLAIVSYYQSCLAITTQIIDCNYEPCIVAYAVYIGCLYWSPAEQWGGGGMGIDYLMPGYGRLRSLRSWDDLFLQNPRSLIERFHPDLDLVCCNT